MSKDDKFSNTYHKANVALGLTAVGLVGAFPFQAQFWGGLILSGCSAGLVGGLADWFAVTALFRKPLGIRPGRIFRTEIIPRNRDRIFEELTHMVQDELLSQEALIQKLSALDYTTLFIKLTSSEGLAKLEPSIQALVEQGDRFLVPMLRELNLEQGQNHERAALKSVIIEVLRKVYKLSLETGTVDKVLDVLVQELNLWVQSPEMHRTLQKWIDDALDDYVSENSSRKIVQMFLPESSTLASKLQMQAVNELTKGQAVQTAKGWLEEFIEGPRFEDIIDQFLFALVQSGEAQTENSQKLTSFFLDRIEKFRMELEGNTEKRIAFNQQIQALLFQVVTSLHDRIGQFVRDGLEKYSNEMLVSLIEDKAGDDLQMIRINGSVVGGLAGVLFYLINFVFR